MSSVHHFAPGEVKMTIDGVSAFYGTTRAIKGVSFQVPTHAATALPPTTAYGTPAASRAAVDRRNRCWTRSMAMTWVEKDGT